MTEEIELELVDPTIIECHDALRNWFINQGMSPEHIDKYTFEECPGSRVIVRKKGSSLTKSALKR